MRRGGLIACALAVLAAAGAVEGVRSNRWGPAADLRAEAAKYDRIPRTVGPWVGTDLPLDPKILAQAEAVGAFSRVYRNGNTGAEVSVLLLCGPPGPIAAHTPAVCYAGLGYEPVGREVRRGVTGRDGPAASYWCGRFAKPSGGPPVEVAWAWGTAGNWVAADSPRAEFFWVSALHKVYFTRTLTPNDQSGLPDPDPIAEFLPALLPELRAALASPPG